MSGASFKIDIAYDDKAVVVKLKQLQQMGGNMQSAFEEIGAELLASTQLRFKDGVSPDGDPWQETKHRPGEAPLIDTGRLKKSISWQADANSMELGTDVEDYAAIHQFGGMAGRGLATEIPARPFLGVSSEDEAAILNIIENHILSAIDAKP